MEALAQLFADRLKVALPFLERTVGFARLSTTTTQNGEAVIPVKLPVPVSFTAAQCVTDERYLVPDLGTAGIAFFEDGGTAPFTNAQFQANAGMKQTSMRLLVWVNPQRLSIPLSEAALLATIERALKINQRYAGGDFLDILTTYTLLPAETSLFSRYTYDTETPLLLPPYRIMGLDLRVQFRLATRCLTDPLPELIDLPSCSTN